MKVKKETTLFYFCIYIFYFFNFLNFLYSCIFLANFKCLASVFFGGSFCKPPTCDVDVHVTKTVSSCMNQLVQLVELNIFWIAKTLFLLINSFVFSKLFYCSSVWGNTSKRNLHKLQLVQNFAARVVLGLKKFDHISQGRRSLKWLDVTEKVLFNDLVLVFKCVNGLAPDYLGKYFIKRSAVHNKNTRGCNNFVVPRCRLSMGQRAFYFRGPREWNGLADNIKNTKDIDSFKRTLLNNMFRTK